MPPQQNNNANQTGVAILLNLVQAVNGLNQTESAGGVNIVTALDAINTTLGMSGGGVTSVSGTAHRITSTGGLAPVIDIAGDYVGQSSITTVGTLTSGATGAGFTIALSTSTITGTLAATNIDANVKVRAITFNKGDGTAVPATGFSGSVTVPYSGTITKWDITADQSGSAVMDIKRSGTSIVGTGNQPTLSGAQSANAAPSGWTSVAVTAGDVISANLNSATTVQFINVVLEVTPA